MKRFTLFASLFFLFFPLLLVAKRVEISEARQVARNFYYERLAVNLRVAIQPGDLVISTSGTDRLGDIPLFYSFNFNGWGYVLVAADDGCYPVLGYSFDSHFNSSEVPENMQNWLDNYRYEIKSVIDAELQASQETAGLWDRYRAEQINLDNISSPTDVAPLIKSMWNQDFPNNAMCPKDPASTGSYYGRVPVGCVATAMSQIMHYWRYPVTGNSSHCIWPSQAAYGQQCANFGNTTYDWNGMPNQTSLESDALAVISYHCGVAVDMQYHPSGSGSNLQKAAYALKTYFNYSSSTQYQNRNSNYTTWVNTLKGNVDSGKPVEYAGDDNSAGHAFVLDGYQQVGSDYMFHFNWGWGGSANGYYYINNLNPNGSNFNYNQNAVVNITPDPSAYPGLYFCSGLTTVTTNFGSIEDGSGPVDDYPALTNCSWLIAPDDSIKTVTLTFASFNTAADDFVKIYDGADANAPLLASYAGTLATMPSVTSTGPKMFITFNTAGSTTGPGWLATFTTTTTPFCNSTTNLTSAWGTIEDGSGRFKYRNISNCKWKIMPPGASKLVLTATSFDTEMDNDKVMIYDLGTSALLATWTGTYSVMPAPVTSATGAVMIMWASNNSVRGEGWEISYSPMVGTDNTGLPSDLAIYPNPARDILNISFTGEFPGNVRTELRTITGRLVLQTNNQAAAGAYRQTIDLKELPNGLYLMQLTTGSGTTVQKIMVEK